MIISKSIISSVFTLSLSLCLFISPTMAQEVSVKKEMELLPTVMKSGKVLAMAPDDLIQHSLSMKSELLQVNKACPLNKASKEQQESIRKIIENFADYLDSLANSYFESKTSQVTILISVIPDSEGYLKNLNFAIVAAPQGSFEKIPEWSYTQAEQPGIECTLKILGRKIKREQLGQARIRKYYGDSFLSQGWDSLSNTDLPTDQK